MPVIQVFWIESSQMIFLNQKCKQTVIACDLAVRILIEIMHRAVGYAIDHELGTNQSISKMAITVSTRYLPEEV